MRVSSEWFRRGRRTCRSSSNKKQRLRRRLSSNNRCRKFEKESKQNPCWLSATQSVVSGHRGQHRTGNLPEGLRGGIDQFEMASVRNLQQLDRFARILFLHGIIAAELGRHDVIFGAVEKPLPGMRYAEL